MKILVAGAGGFIETFGKNLLEEGHDLVCADSSQLNIGFKFLKNVKISL